MKFTTFYSIFVTFFRVYILGVKVTNLRVLVTISKIAQITPFVFPQITQNDFQWDFSISQYGWRGGGAKTFWRFGASSRCILGPCVCISTVTTHLRQFAIFFMELEHFWAKNATNKKQSETQHLGGLSVWPFLIRGHF